MLREKCLNYVVLQFLVEKIKIYIEIYETLKYNYPFIPKKITMDFALSNLKDVNDVYMKLTSNNTLFISFITNLVEKGHKVWIKKNLC